jgi:hypothetical protein
MDDLGFNYQQAQEFSPLQVIETASESCTFSYSKGTKGFLSLSGDKVAGVVS